MKSIEILAVVESVSNEKGLEEEVIFKAIEAAIASASIRHFHEDAELQVEIDRNEGTYKTFRFFNVTNEDDPEFHPKAIFLLNLQD